MLNKLIPLFLLAPFCYGASLDVLVQEDEVMARISKNTGTVDVGLMAALTLSDVPADPWYKWFEDFYEDDDIFLGVFADLPIPVGPVVVAPGWYAATEIENGGLVTGPEVVLDVPLVSQFSALGMYQYRMYYGRLDLEENDHEFFLGARIKF